MDTTDRCVHVTQKGTRCKFRSKTDGVCSRHANNNCPICFESTGNTKYTLGCGHVFHKACIMSWFVQSDVCPVCREKQDDDIFKFKEGVEDKMRNTYKDVLDSNDREIARLRRMLAHYRPTFMEPL